MSPVSSRAARWWRAISAAAIRTPPMTSGPGCTSGWPRPRSRANFSSGGDRRGRGQLGAQLVHGQHPRDAARHQLEGHLVMVGAAHAPDALLDEYRAEPAHGGAERRRVYARVGVDARDEHDIRLEVAAQNHLQVGEVETVHLALVAHHEIPVGHQRGHHLFTA